MEQETSIHGEDVPFQRVGKNKDKFIKSFCISFRNNALLIVTLICVLFGVVTGMSCRPLKLSPDTVYLLGFPGEIFMRIFKMLLLPLLASSMVTGLANLKGQSKGKLGFFTMIYYICTTGVAIAISITLTVTIRPGEVTVADTTVVVRGDEPLPTAADTILDLIRNLFPPNIVQAAVQNSKTTFSKILSADRSINHSGFQAPCLNISSNEAKNGRFNLTCEIANSSDTDLWKKTVTFHEGLNVIGNLLFFAVFGVVLNQLGERGQLMVEFFNILNEIILNMTKLTMWFCPVGIMYIIINKILSVSDLATAVQRLGMYMITGLSGLAIHSVIVLPTIYFFLTRQNPFRVSLNILQAVVTGLGTSSSSAALPITLYCCENKLKFDKNICHFVLPIGATINMDGLAIIQAMTQIFLAQMNDKYLTFGDILTISLSATLSSIGAAGVPGTGFLTMLAVVAATGLPVEDAYIVLSVDWFMMRMVTMVNIYGDALAVGVLTRFFSSKLPSRLNGKDQQLNSTQDNTIV